MLPLSDSVIEKIDHAVERIQAVKGSSRSLVDTAAALDALADRLATLRAEVLTLTGSHEDSETLRNYCDVVLGDLFKLLPHVGFLHRSRNASNPFELHGPIRRLAREFIGEDVRLIISNEWEFSPYTHPSMAGIEGFVLLGLPASETAENCLLVPIVGHELGHIIWKRTKLRSRLKAPLAKEVLDRMRERIDEVIPQLGLAGESDLQTERALLVREDLTERALAQCEELFCDLCGLVLFGESYCHAFAYLLAPGLLAYQDNAYPSALDRAGYLKEAGQELTIDVPGDLADPFILPDTADLSSDIVSAAVDEMFEVLLKELRVYTTHRGITSPKRIGIDSAKAQLRVGSPVEFTSTLPEILCAAWEMRLDLEHPWQSKPQWRSTDYRMLNELVLKSAEAIEYWARVEGGASAK